MSHYGHILFQHSDEAASLRLLRTRLVRSAQIGLRDLARFDERIEAHIDALRVGGALGWFTCKAQLDDGGLGEVFAAGVLALQSEDENGIAEVLRIAEESNAVSAVVSACGWVLPSTLRGRARSWLSSGSEIQRLLGVGACAVHRVVAENIYRDALTASDCTVRARALKAIGETGAAALLADCKAHLTDDDQVCRCVAAWTLVLLGNRHDALPEILETSISQGSLNEHVLAVVLRAAPLEEVRGVLSTLRKQLREPRLLVWGAGVSGDPQYLPWIIQQMADSTLSRVAGEAFVTVTGCDLVQNKLTSDPIPTVETGPNDEPDDELVAPDPDDGLPWPDSEKCGSWWVNNSNRFKVGTRYFMGAPVSRENCLAVLMSGNQRQRIAAAQHLCLVEPGTPLFNTSAPAWRQQRLLANRT